MASRLALFDLDNTLIDRAALFRGWALDSLRRWGADDGDVGWLIELDRDGLTERESFFEAVRTRYGIPETTPDLVTAYYEDYPSFTVPPSPETLAALRSLRDRDWRTCIVTNGPTMQEEVVDRAGLREIVDAVCVSSTVGLRKPDPLIFQHAADLSGLPLTGAWMIGDSPSHDMGGAIAAGLKSVWISRGREWVEPQYQPTLIATTVTDAVAQMLAAEDAVR